jgi:hypothetical protein
MAAAIGTQGIQAFLSALDYARAGIRQGVASYEQVAASVAGAVAHPVAISAENEVAAVNARSQVTASAKVFATADQLLGTILDLRA